VCDWKTAISLFTFTYKLPKTTSQMSVDTTYT